MEIEAPDGTVVEFPDGTPPETIKRVMRSQFGGPEAAPTAAPQSDRIQVPFDTPAVAPGTPLPPRPQESPLGAITRYASGAQKALLEGMLLGGRGEVLSALDSAAGRGSMAEMESRRDAELNAVPDAVRVPAEVLGGVATTGISGPIKSMIARSILPGAVYGYNASEGTPQERLPGAAVGAGAALAGEGLMRGVARVMSPKSSPQVQTMRSIGVSPTPGQSLGGTARRIEEKLTSVPFLGDAIKSAERRALNQFNVGAINRALSPAGLSLPKGTQPGREAVETAMSLFDDAYDNAIPPSVRVKYDRAIADQMKAVSDNAADLLDEAGMRIVRRQIAKIQQPGSSAGTSLTGDRAKEIVSELRKVRSRYSSSQLASEQNVGDVLGEIEDAFNKLLIRNLPDKSGQTLRNVDRAYANWKRIERAASSIGADEGAFTPAQLQNAVRAMDPSVNRRAFARGDALMQDVSEAGKSTLSSKFPNSGTTDRGLLTALAASGGGYAVDPVLGAGIATGIGVPSLAYTPWMQRLMANLISGRQGAGPKAAADAVRSLAPVAGITGAIAASR